VPWAATACRARATRPPPSCAATRWSCRTPAPPCWCWKWCPRAVDQLTAELPHCHTIGIGAGKGTAGQVLVLHDMLGVNLGKMAKFVHNFMQGAASACRRGLCAGRQERQLPGRRLHAW
jgi:hypothetical protein